MENPKNTPLPRNSVRSSVRFLEALGRVNDAELAALLCLEKVDNPARVFAVTSSMMSELRERGEARNGYTERRNVNLCVHSILRGRRCRDWFHCFNTFPLHDHPALLLKDGKPVGIRMYFYQASGRQISELIDYCAGFGLSCEFNGDGTYFPGRAFLVEIRKDERK